jgi:phosphate transport system protein
MTVSARSGSDLAAPQERLPPASRTSDPSEPHTSRSVDASVASLRLQAVAMGGLVIDQVAGSVRALLHRDAALADLVLSREELVNAYERRIDADSLTFIALQQPVANDLRLARALVRISRELERVGDESKKIARFALTLERGVDDMPVMGVARHLRHMADLSVSMLRNSVRAADEMDLERASAVLAQDAEVDAEFVTALRSSAPAPCSHRTPRWTPSSRPPCARSCLTCCRTTVS